MVNAHRSDAYESIRVNTKAVVFLGTPHRGSSSATLGKVIGDIVNIAFKVTTRLLPTLALGSEELGNLSEDFVPCSTSLLLHTFYETEKHPITNSLVGFVDLNTSDSFLSPYSDLA